MEARPQLPLFVLQARTQDERVRLCDSDLFFSFPRLSWLKRNIKVLIVLERSMRRHKAFCSCAQKIIHKVNHWHLFKDFYKRVFQDEHLGRSLRPWEGLLSEAYLWGKCLWQRSLLNLGVAAAAKSLQSCPTLCDPIDGSPPGSPIPGILQARTLERVAIFFSNPWKWNVKMKSLSQVWLLATPWTAAHQAPPSMGLARQEYWSGVPLPSPEFRG